MSINTQQLFDQKKNQYGTGTSTQRFTSDFIQAVNRTINEVNIKVGLDLDPITTIGVNIDADETKYEFLLSIGVDYHLSHIGSYETGDRRELKDFYEDARRTARTQVMKDAEVKGRFGDLTD